MVETGLTFYEFFAGGGMARAGLGKRWRCCFANDFDSMKAATYTANWGGDDLVVEDINLVTLSSLPVEVDLAWASFPCQDLSLAGNYAGIGQAHAREQTRSGTFWPFWGLMQGLVSHHRAPRIIILENVYGTLTSNHGSDFAAISESLASAGYQYGAVVIDARLFLPHSRPRVFIIAVRGDIAIPAKLRVGGPIDAWHPRALRNAQLHVMSAARQQWVWWNLPFPAVHSKSLADIVEDPPTGIEWHTKAETAKLISMMSPLNFAKLATAKKARKQVVGSIYKRTRDGSQRAEVRFDGIAGCLRTPGGGSSRQIIIVVDGAKVRSRLLSAREAARLMGLPDGYMLPERYNDGYRVAGDGVVVPVVRHIAGTLIEPILDAMRTSQREVA